MPPKWAAWSCILETERCPLLLVIHHGTGDLLAVGIGSGLDDCASLAVGRDCDLDGSCYFAVFLDAQRQVPSVNLRVGSGIRRSVAGDRVILAVELADPLVVNGFAGGIRTV